MIATRNVFERTLEAFARGTLPPATGEDGRDVLEVIAAAYHSATTGRRVQLDSDEVQRLVRDAHGRTSAKPPSDRAGAPRRPFVPPSWARD